ncbi:triphosphoribosyl-dephospho-CoA synthase [Bombilactobacillus thymidiniphilus]|uniref:Probable 2-(5''-triphosphoribosyl)-3'-dephosphocoenzyme-A synthase n=1 Tax=Bombilactobacillus thymidiniphilus TaxID=2923363 RepID=A0ABY4PC97_9LACO|nr:triphosphoribosyl-dephospho-CoA synthase [Bombilactobacillus thymidiniphilus]UQS83167.1 triphosphoribosyl-dephospho-CoA synthase [Bombilactobacillus thymidiniphilus]
MSEQTKFLAQMAQKALLYEVVVHPKPGLVDPVDTGSHTDMDIFTFLDSTVSLLPYFQQASQLGASFVGDKLPALFQQLRVLGRQAEKTMFAATHNINTHKGAIFSLGIAIGATSFCWQHEKRDLPTIQATIQGMLVNLIRDDLGAAISKKSPQTAGEQQFVQYGLLGIRGQAQAGFPVVIEQALPFLRQSHGTTNTRLLDTLMLILQYTDDSNLIKRAHSQQIMPWARQQAQRYFDLGGANTRSGMAFLHKLNQKFIRYNLSLGGCADLLILTIYFGLLENII